MKLLSFNIPEVEHLPPDQRESILKRCVAREEMQRYRRVVPRFLGFVPCVLGVAFFFTALFHWHWSFASSAQTSVGIVVLSVPLMIVVKLCGEVWLLRRLAKREIEKP